MNFKKNHLLSNRNTPGYSDKKYDILGDIDVWPSMNIFTTKVLVIGVWFFFAGYIDALTVSCIIDHRNFKQFLNSRKILILNFLLNLTYMTGVILFGSFIFLITIQTFLEKFNKSKIPSFISLEYFIKVHYLV